MGIMQGSRPDSYYVKCDYLLNGAAYNMAVNGSVTPVEYTFSPTGTDNYILDTMTISLVDIGVFDYDEFASIGSALTNGVKIEIRSNGTTTELFNLKDNLDLFSFFTCNKSLEEISDLLEGSFAFRPELVLNNSTSDFVKVTIRDNLSNLNVMRVLLSYHKEVI